MTFSLNADRPFGLIKTAPACIFAVHTTYTHYSYTPVAILQANGNGTLKLYGSIVGITGALAGLIFGGIAYIDARIETEAIKHEKAHNMHILQPHLGAVTGDNLEIHLTPVNRTLTQLATEVRHNSRAVNGLTVQMEKLKTIMEERNR